MTRFLWKAHPASVFVYIHFSKNWAISRDWPKFQKAWTLLQSWERKAWKKKERNIRGNLSFSTEWLPWKEVLELINQKWIFRTMATFWKFTGRIKNKNLADWVGKGLNRKAIFKYVMTIWHSKNSLETSNWTWRKAFLTENYTAFRVLTGMTP